MMKQREQQHWASIREAGSHFGIATLIGAYRLGGGLMFRIFLAPVMVYFFLFRHESRHASLDYLNRLSQFDSKLPIKPSYWCSFQHFWQFGLALIDKLAVWMGKIELDKNNVAGFDAIDKALQAGTGAVLLVSHLGNFEISRAMSRYFHNVRMTILIHDKHAQNFTRLLKKYDRSDAVEFVQVTEVSPATAMLLSERIEQGELVVIAGDRIPVSGDKNFALVDFLGEKAPLPIGPYVLASILGAPVFTLFCLRRRSIYHVYIDKLSEPFKARRSEREKVFQVLAQSYADQLQKYCRLEPLQWFNFFHFWAQVPAGDKDSNQANNIVER